MIKNTIFFHGWGYNNLFWAEHAQNYKNTHISFYNRGYYGIYHKPFFNKAEKNICVTHSTGLFFVAQEYNLSDFDDIIIYAGFTEFPNKKTVRTMRLAMTQNNHNNFIKILYRFYENCGFNPLFSDKLNNNELNKEKLINDLTMLETFNVTNILNTVNYTAYHGENDMIVINPLKGAKIIKNTGHLCNLI